MKNSVKIIAGKWRNTKLVFIDALGVRPTNIRLRETLFNWLTPFIANCDCLDLFAGSGALGLEALSRGAKTCAFVDILDANIKNLQATKSKLQTSAMNLFKLDYASFLANNKNSFDIIFLDPPFNCELLSQALAQLTNLDFLQAKFIYVETQKHQNFLPPKNFTIFKTTSVGNSTATLFMRI